MMKRSLIKKAVFAAIGAFCSITALANVAKIGETEYPTLDLAFEAVKDNETIVLQEDIVTDKITIPAAKTFTIDLNNKKIKALIFAASGSNSNLTLKNGYLENNSSYCVHFYDGSLTFTDINMSVLNNHGVRAEGPVSCVVNSGTYFIKNTKTGEASYYLMYCRGNGANFTFYDGNFVGDYGVSTLYCTNATYLDSFVKIFGGTFSGFTKVLAGNKGSITISGGKFTFISSETYGITSNITGPCEISGGTFNFNSGIINKVKEKWIKAGYGIAGPVDGYYTVQKANYALIVNAENATVSELNATYQYEDEVTFTVTPATGYKVTSVKLGTDELTADANGNYTFFMPAEAATITVTTEAASTFDVMINGQPVDNADALKEEAKAGAEMTVPETSTWTAEGNILKKDGEAYVEFADYYTVVVNGTTITLKLNKPVIGDSSEGADDAFTVTTDAVTIKITNYNSALKYGVRSAADISGLSTAAITTVTPTAGVITLEKAGDCAFFEVVVSDVPFAE